MNTLEYRQKVIKTRKIEVVNQARDLHSKNYSLRKIAEELNIDRRTVKKYIDPNFTPTYTRHVYRRTILDPYKAEIDELFKKGNTSSFIYNTISQKGYKVSGSNLRHYCSKLKKMLNANSGQVEVKKIIIKRKDIFKLLYKPVKSIKGLSIEDVDKVKLKYPFFKDTMELFTKFKEIINDRKVDQLDKWLDSAKSLNNSYINSFVNGITRDIDAIGNAIIYEYNNGLAEGNVNKLKVIKRIMYGRNKFEMLRKKVLYLELNRKIN